MRPFQHLQNVNLSKNDIRDVSEVMHLPYILNINANTNSVRDMKFFEMHSGSM